MARQVLTLPDVPGALLTQAVADPLYLSPTEGDAAYLKLTGGTLSGNLGVGVAPAAWGGAHQALQVGGIGAFWADKTTTGNEGVYLSDNTYFDGSTFRAIGTSGGAGYLRLQQGILTLASVPAVAAGAAQTFTTRLSVAQNGTVSVTPDAGAAALLAGTAGGLYPGYAGLPANTFTITASANMFVRPSGGVLAPYDDNATSSGVGTNRWSVVYAVAGTINTSLAEAKQDITPLAPEDALAAVRATDPVLFDYKPPERTAEWYELPDDPEQAAQVLEQRLRAAPLEEGARHQAGVVLDHDTYRTDPLFQTGDGQTNASNSFGVLLAALKAVDARLTALEGA